VRGYRWKSLFLPEGTVLRSWSYGDHNYARVEGDRIIHDGKSVSPNQFAQSFARTTRNAWTDLYIRRPEDKQFKSACRLRQELAEAATIITPALPDAQHVLALITALQAQAQHALAQAAAPEPRRDVNPGPSWTLPERRKFRFRLEDVAFD